MIIINISNTKLTNNGHDQPKINKCKKRNKVHIFECGCFDCYTRFWYRWDSSPNRDLIHQVIEAFEDNFKAASSFRKNKKDKVSVNPLLLQSEQSQCSEILMVAKNRDGCEPESEENVQTGNPDLEVVVVAVASSTTGVRLSHKGLGLARKVLPNVVSLFNSRLWSLWGPCI